MGELPVRPDADGQPAAGDESVDMIAAALRADAADLDTLIRVLGASLTDTLPAGMVEVQRVRSLADRLAKRAGTPVSITVTTPELRLGLTHAKQHGGVVGAEMQRIVRGVVISRQEVTVDEWVRSLAVVLNDLAARNAATQQALSRLLGAS